MMPSLALPLAAWAPSQSQEMGFAQRVSLTGTTVAGCWAHPVEKTGAATTNTSQTAYGSLMTITRQRLLEVLAYDSALGTFTWRMSTNNRVKAGRLAGNVMKPRGYVQISIDGRRYLAHKLAWFLATNTWPDQIDHINRITGDNRLANLRPATRGENALNSKRTTRNRSGYKGVARCRNGWRAYIGSGSTRRDLGSFATPEDAAAVRRAAAIALYGPFAADE